MAVRLSYVHGQVGRSGECAHDVPGEVADLAAHFLDVSARRSKKAVRAIDGPAMHALCRYAWPGNVRELENVIERAVIVAKGDTITDVERFLTGEAARSRVDLSLPFRDAKARVVEEFERLRRLSGVDAILLTGRSRPYDRDVLFKDWLPRIQAGRGRAP